MIRVSTERAVGAAAEVAAIEIAESIAEQRVITTVVLLTTDTAEEENQGVEVKNETELVVGAMVEELTESRAKEINL